MTVCEKDVFDLSKTVSRQTKPYLRVGKLVYLSDRYLCFVRIFCSSKQFLEFTEGGQPSINGVGSVKTAWPSYIQRDVHCGNVHLGFRNLPHSPHSKLLNHIDFFEMLCVKALRSTERAVGVFPLS